MRLFALCPNCYSPLTSAPAALSINPARGVGVGACTAVVEKHLAVLIVSLAGVADPIAKLHGIFFARLLCHSFFHPCGGVAILPRSESVRVGPQARFCCAGGGFGFSDLCCLRGVLHEEPRRSGRCLPSSVSRRLPCSTWICACTSKNRLKPKRRLCVC